MNTISLLRSLTVILLVGTAVSPASAQTAAPQAAPDLKIDEGRWLGSLTNSADNIGDAKLMIDEDRWLEPLKPSPDGKPDPSPLKIDEDRWLEPLKPKPQSNPNDAKLKIDEERWLGALEAKPEAPGLKIDEGWLDDLKPDPAKPPRRGRAPVRGFEIDVQMYERELAEQEAERRRRDAARKDGSRTILVERHYVDQCGTFTVSWGGTKRCQPVKRTKWEMVAVKDEGSAGRKDAPEERDRTDQSTGGADGAAAAGSYASGAPIGGPAGTPVAAGRPASGPSSSPRPATRGAPSGDAGFTTGRLPDARAPVRPQSAALEPEW